ncbi:MAG: hypothetical protein ACK4K7_04420 [Allosphingosinicella sp.]|uniref:hypothetical protein n=1 Tax=Allosphingosinicella sp. TaxID=2823234 RepID=UPI0039405DB6
MRIAAPLLPLALAACATAVYHPEKSEEEMRADIDRCSAEAKAVWQPDPLVTYENAHRCLEALGYRRDRPGLGAGVRQSVDRGRAPAAAPCRVPCS